jgi:Xaa-Pro dipeptidase
VTTPPSVVPAGAPELVSARRDEVRTKVDRVRQWLEGRGSTALLLGSQPNFAWITAGGRNHVSIGESTGVASVLVTMESSYVVTTNIELRRIVEEEIAGLPFEAVDCAWYEEAGLSAAVAELCDTGDAVSDVPVPPLSASGGFAHLRFVMQPTEAARYRALATDAADAVELACREATPGQTEQDIAARVAHECIQKDILPLVDLVASDERIGRYRHPIPSDKRVERILLVALTGRRHGLHASLTRMVSFSRADPELEARYRSVTRVDALAIAESRPGRSLREIVLREADQYANEGFPGEWRLHHQGGLTGYAGREIFATPRATHRLEAGQVVAWNPSITRVKSEDTVLIGENGFEILTSTAEWPQTTVEINGFDVPRPAILVQ